MKNVVCRSVLASLAALCISSALGAQTIVYREVFPTEATSSCSGDKSSCQSDVVADSWYAGQQGDTIVPASPTTQDLQQIPEGAPSTAGSGNEPGEIASGAADADGITGAALYERSERFGVFLFTDEFSIASASVGAVRFEARNDMDDEVPLDLIDMMGNQSGPPVSLALSPTMRPAFCISNTWYVATTENGQNITSPATWLSFDFGLLGLEFEVAPTGTSCLELPTMPRTDNVPCTFMTNCGENPHTTVTGLPAGTIDAFGIYWDKNWATDSIAPSGSRIIGSLGQVRIDNFELTGLLNPVENCTGADLGNTDMFSSGGFFDPSTDDFTMTGFDCTELGVDSVLCFTPQNNCNLRYTCNSDSGTQAVNVFAGSCTTTPTTCLDSETGTGAVSVGVPVFAGSTICVVCEYDGSGDNPSMSFTELDGSDCGLLPIELQSFSIDQ